VLGLRQHIAPATHTNELAFAHEAAYLLRMYAQSREIARLQDSPGAGRCCELFALPKIKCHVRNHT
jgi:hypothetical protein